MEDRLEEKISIDNANCIPTLYISRSELKNEDGDTFDFWGLYNDTDLKPGDFIGMYNGIWIHESEGFSFGHKYAIELSHGMMVAPPGQRPNPQKYPIAMANEPHKDGEANSTMVELIFGREHIDNIPHDVKDERFYGIGMFACKDIPKGTEILWFYGNSYAKIRDTEKYKTVTQGCTIKDYNHPNQVLQKKLCYNAVTPFIDSPSNSSSEEEYTETKRRKYKGLWKSEVQTRALCSIYRNYSNIKHDI
jgi:hypothetical protein